MLDLTLATRIDVDETYDELVSSHGFVHYRGVLAKWDHPPHFDGVIMRFYNEQGEVVEERSPRMSLHSLRRGETPDIPAFVTRLDRESSQITWAATSAASSNSLHWGDTAAYYVQQGPDREGDYVLMDQFRPVFVPAEEVRGLHVNHRMAMPKYVFLCLIYERAERWQREQKLVKQHYAIDPAFAGKYTYKADSSSFSPFITGTTS